MKTKLLEIRDRGTCIPVLAIQMVAQSYIETKYLERTGYDEQGSCVVLMDLNNQNATSDPQGWHYMGRSQRTFGVAHDYIIDNWGQIREGDVIDVCYICKETHQVKVAEILNTDLVL